MQNIYKLYIFNKLYWNNFLLKQLLFKTKIRYNINSYHLLDASISWMLRWLKFKSRVNSLQQVILACMSLKNFNSFTSCMNFIYVHQNNKIDLKNLFAFDKESPIYYSFFMIVDWIVLSWCCIGGKFENFSVSSYINYNSMIRLYHILFYKVIYQTIFK